MRLCVSFYFGRRGDAYAGTLQLIAASRDAAGRTARARARAGGGPWGGTTECSHPPLARLNLITAFVTFQYSYILPTLK